MHIVYSDDDFVVKISKILYDKFIIVLNSAAGLDRIGIENIMHAEDKYNAVPEDLFKNFKVNEIHLLCKNANWYQRKTIQNVISCIENIIKNHRHNTIIYGSSMGGFGAIHLGAELSITSIAFSPQASLDYTKFYIPRSWRIVYDYALHINKSFYSNICNKKCSQQKIYLFYDFKDILDRSHALSILKNCCNVHSFNIPFSGHGCSKTINKYFSIKNIVIQILNNNFNDTSFRRIFFKKYPLQEMKTHSAEQYFSYLKKIIDCKDFDIYIGLLKSKSDYIYLLHKTIHYIEKNNPDKLDECLKIISHENPAQLYKNTKRVNYFSSHIYQRLYYCAKFYFNRNRFLEACPLFKKILSFDFTNFELMLYYITSAYKAEVKFNYVDFINDFIQFNGLNSGNDDNYFIAKAYFNIKKFKKSLGYWVASLQHSKTCSKCILYAKALKESGKVDVAIHFLKENLSLFENNSEFLAYLGAYCFYINDFENSKSYLFKCRSINDHPKWINYFVDKLKLLNKVN